MAASIGGYWNVDFLKPRQTHIKSGKKKKKPKNKIREKQNHFVFCHYIFSNFSFHLLLLWLTDESQERFCKLMGQNYLDISSGVTCHKELEFNSANSRRFVRRAVESVMHFSNQSLFADLKKNVFTLLIIFLLTLLFNNFLTYIAYSRWPWSGKYPTYSYRDPTSKHSSETGKKHGSEQR